ALSSILKLSLALLALLEADLKSFATCLENLATAADAALKPLLNCEVSVPSLAVKLAKNPISYTSYHPGIRSIYPNCGLALLLLEPYSISLYSIAASASALNFLGVVFQNCSSVILSSTVPKNNIKGQSQPSSSDGCCADWPCLFPRLFISLGYLPHPVVNPPSLLYSFFLLGLLSLINLFGYPHNAQTGFHPHV